MKTISYIFLLMLISIFSFGLDSSLTMKRLQEKPQYEADYYYVWAINLDDKDGDEYVVAWGYSDGIDYSVYSDPKNEKTLKFRFNPVLVDESNKSQPFYWGYPWDIRNIITKKEGKQIKILCSFEHEIVRDGEIDIPKWQKKIPALFFTGKSTQPDIPVAKIKKQLWLTLDQIEKIARGSQELP